MFKKYSNRQLALLSNFVEFYDLYLYVHLAFLINTKFFPNLPSDHFLLKGFATFNLYFLAPVACIGWAFIGDLQGRKKVLIYSSIVMSFTTFFIACLPEYSRWPDEYGGISIGLLLLLRVVQGIAMAGEPIAAKLFAIEDSENIESETPRWVYRLDIADTFAGFFALLIVSISVYWLNFSWSWRIPFIVAFLSIVVTVFIRKNIHETNEYLIKSGNQPIGMFDERKIADFYKTLSLKNKNMYFYVPIAITYPLMFVMNYINISPLVLKKFGYAPDRIFYYNLLLGIGELFIKFSIVNFALKFSLPKKRIQQVYQLIALCMLLFFAFDFLNKDYPIWFYLGLQILMMGFIYWGLIYGSIIKCFPVTERFTILSFASAMARITVFLLTTFILAPMITMYGLSWACWIAVFFIVSGIIAVSFYIPYEELDKIYLQKRYDSYTPVKEDVYVMTKENIEKSFNKKNWPKNKKHPNY